MKDVLSFGPFALNRGERVLSRAGKPVELGGRSLDILIALIARANEVVSKRELLAQVWPDTVVEEGSLRYQIVGLRKALGDGVDGARYITTVAGRGYCFVAPIMRADEREMPSPMRPATVPHNNLPSRLLRMVGRADDVHQISRQLAEQRFVTIVGSGGVGKTTVAIAVGHDLGAAFEGAVLFVDLGAIADPALIATTVATMLGLSVQTEDAVSILATHLRDRRVLLILDTCEHLIDAVARLASSLFDSGPQVHVLATSREALRVEGEHVYPLAPLPCPPDDPSLTAGVAQTFPAAQLFLDRARATGVQMDFTDAEAVLIASICRKLDGVALAIELAAGRVLTYGLQKTAALLDESLTLSWPGRRTAPPRQRTLQATLDWSYGLLTSAERIVLRRLSVFVGFFTFEAALQVAASASVDEEQVFRALESLIDKSLVSASPVGAMMRYRLLDTTRTYALQADSADTESTEPAVRHAHYFRRWLEQMAHESSALSNPAERAPHLAALGNVRAALEWSFGPTGNTEIGVALAAAAVPIFLAMSLLTECHRWSGRALSMLSDASRGGPEEMRLQAGLGMSLMFTRNHGDEARDAFTRSLAIAEQRADAANQMLLLGPLHMFHFRRGEYRTSLEYARRSARAAATLADPVATAIAHCLTGISLHSMGELQEARTELEASLQYEPDGHRSRTLHLGFDYYNWAGIALGRTLWMLGHRDQAIEQIQRTLENAQRLDHQVTLTILLHWAAAVYLWNDDLTAAERHVDWFLSSAESHSLGPYLAVGRGLKGVIAIRRGDPKTGVEMLESALKKLHASRYELVTTPFNLALAQGLAGIDRNRDGLEVIDTTLRNVEANGDLCFRPELLRVKSRLLFSAQPPDLEGAESCLVQALECARQQSAAGWEQRAQADLTALKAAMTK